MGTNWAPPLADVFLYSYEADFIQSLLLMGKETVSISVCANQCKWGKEGNSHHKYDDSYT